MAEWLDHLIRKAGELSSDDPVRSAAGDLGQRALLGTLNLGAQAGTRLMGRPLSQAPEIRQEHLPFQTGAFGILNPNHPAHSMPGGPLPINPLALVLAAIHAREDPTFQQAPLEPGIAAISRALQQQRGIAAPPAELLEPLAAPDGAPVEGPRPSPVNDPRAGELPPQFAPAQLRKAVDDPTAPYPGMGPELGDVRSQWDPRTPAPPAPIAPDTEGPHVIAPEPEQPDSDLLERAAAFMIEPGKISDDPDAIENFVTGYESLNEGQKVAIQGQAWHQLQAFMLGKAGVGSDISFDEAWEYAILPLMTMMGSPPEQIQATRKDLEQIAEAWAASGTEEDFYSFMTRQFGR